MPTAFRLATLLATSLLCTGTASAQQPGAMPQGPAPATSEASGQEADHEALRGLRRTYEQAIRDNRIELLQPHLHGEFHGVMVTGQAVDSFADLQQYWRDIHALMGEGGSYTTTLNPELSTIVGDLALARGTTDDVVRTSEAEYRFTTAWSAVLQREGGEWKIRRVQGTMDPVSNPFVREFTRRTVRLTAAIAGVIGAVLGALVGFVWARRRARVA